MNGRYGHVEGVDLGNRRERALLHQSASESLGFVGDAENGNIAEKFQALGCGVAVASSGLKENELGGEKIEVRSSSFPPLAGDLLVSGGHQVRAGTAGEIADNRRFEI